MPIFRTDYLLANGKRIREHCIVDGIELDNYYLYLHQKIKPGIIIMDIVQISEHSHVAKQMRENNHQRIVTSRTRRRR